MALARKGSRTIQVDAVVYRWVVSPDSGHMSIVVEHDANPGQRLEATVRYRDRDPTGRAQITPAVVRRAIQIGLLEGWTPTQRGVDHFRLVDADDRVWDDGA